MLLPELSEGFFNRKSSSGGNIGAALANGFRDATLCSDIQETLVLLCRLYDGFGFAVDGEDDGAACFFELLHHLDGVVAEGGEGLDVLGDVDHVATSLEVFYRTF